MKTWPMVGAVLSIFTWTVFAASALPATSVLKNVTVWSPSVSSVKLVPVCCAPPSTEYFVEATPEPLSVGLRVTVTSPFTQVFDVPLIPVFGAVRSIWMPVTVLVVLLPALSVQVAVEERFEPSPFDHVVGGRARDLGQGVGAGPGDGDVALVPAAGEGAGEDRGGLVDVDPGDAARSRSCPRRR